MRSLIAIAAVILTVATGAQATSSLSFEAEGYLLDIVVGDAAQPAVSSLSIATPGSQQGTPLPMQHVRVEIFDAPHRVLLLRFRNPQDSTLPESFLLTVKDGIGTLRVGERSLVGRFSWGL